MRTGRKAILLSSSSAIAAHALVAVFALTPAQAQVIANPGETKTSTARPLPPRRTIHRRCMRLALGPSPVRGQPYRPPARFRRALWPKMVVTSRCKTVQSKQQIKIHMVCGRSARIPRSPSKIQPSGPPVMEPPAYSRISRAR